MRQRCLALAKIEEFADVRLIGRPNDVVCKWSGSGRATRASSLSIHAASAGVIYLIDDDGFAVSVRLAVVANTAGET